MIASVETITNLSHALESASPTYASTGQITELLISNEAPPQTDEMYRVMPAA